MPDQSTTGVKITLNDGTIEYYDPVTYVHINNGHFDYYVRVTEIKSIEAYIPQDDKG